MLTKTQASLDYQSSLSDDTGVSFRQPVEDGYPEWGLYLDMSHETWADMAYPRSITVTVEPGDVLDG